MDTSDLNQRLRELRHTLPKGCLFAYHLADDQLYIERLTIPGSIRQQGQHVGTRFMTAVLAAADEAEIPVTLHARATGRPGDPPQRPLEAWYERLGFQPLHEEEEGLFMQRAVARPTPEVTASVTSSARRRRP
jgi:hypothetical protein